MINCCGDQIRGHDADSDLVMPHRLKVLRNYGADAAIPSPLGPHTLRYLYFLCVTKMQPTHWHLCCLEQELAESPCTNLRPTPSLPVLPLVVKRRPFQECHGLLNSGLRAHGDGSGHFPKCAYVLVLARRTSTSLHCAEPAI
jgi:hypothetical protein